MQKDNILIKYAEMSDVPNIARIESESIDEPWSESQFISALLSDSDILLAASYNNCTIGFIEASFVLDEININSIAVDAEYRKLGIASMLIASLEKIISGSAEKLMLEVRSRNIPALNLYRKLGFSEDGKRKNFYSHPPDDAVLMTKLLKNKE